MQPAMDPVARVFAELNEANGAVRVRFHPEIPGDIGDPSNRKHWNSTERTMTYREYRVWLSNARANGLVLERVEQVRKPHD